MTAQKPAWDVWYTTRRWRKLRLQQLAKHPLCAMCKARGVIAAATVAHHTKQHHGNLHLFWFGELESLCSSCHNRDAQAAEKSGTRPRLPPHDDGWPAE